MCWIAMPGGPKQKNISKPGQYTLSPFPVSVFEFGDRVYCPDFASQAVAITAVELGGAAATGSGSNFTLTSFETPGSCMVTP